MSKERKFQKLIQEQDPEGKDKLWDAIENKVNSEEVDLGGVLAKKQILSKQNKIIICVSTLLAVVIGIVLICRFVPNHGNNVTDDFRYCEVGDYYSLDVDESIKDYATANSLNLLYFSWYEEAEYYADTHYKMKESDEIICLCEELVDSNGYYIFQYIAEEKTQIDFLKVYSESCVEQTVIKSVEVKYGAVIGNSYANFNYGGHNYYFKLESTDTDYLLALLNEIIV